MRVAIVPGFADLTITVNPARGVTVEDRPLIIMPWLYAPWPDAQEKGLVEIEVEGETLRALLAELSLRYKQADVDFEPINPRTNDVDFDYDVIVNGRNFVALPGGLDVKLKDGDEVKVKTLWRWDG